MNETNPYLTFPLKTLIALRDLQVSKIKSERLQLEQIELAIRSAQHPAMRHLLSIEDQRQLLTSGGSIRDIASWAIKILEAYGRAMTASDIAEVMYSYSWPVDLRQFKRRVVVAVSFVANLDDRSQRTILKGGTAENREAWWVLPSWMKDGDILPEHKPKDNDMEEP